MGNTSLLAYGCFAPKSFLSGFFFFGEETDGHHRTKKNRPIYGPKIVSIFVVSSLLDYTELQDIKQNSFRPFYFVALLII